MRYQYKVTKQYQRGNEMHFAEFETVKKAKDAIASEMQNNIAMNVKVIYRLYELGEEIECFDPDKQTAANIPTSSPESAAGGKTSGAGFRPTPFNTSPRPTGTPHKWTNDDDEKEKK